MLSTQPSTSFHPHARGGRTAHRGSRSRGIAIAMTIAATTGLLSGEGIVAQSAPPAPAASVLGFTAQRAAQRGARGAIRRRARRRGLETWMQRLAARPHHVGSPGAKETPSSSPGSSAPGATRRDRGVPGALPDADERRAGDGRARRDSPPRSPSRPLPEDATSGQTAEQLPTYNAYSIDGDVTGELVYVNYGVPEDYEELERRGIDVKGKIVIARYGGSWRGIKPKVAAEHGAIGCIIYSDPATTATRQGDAYPKGGWRPGAGRAARLGGRHAGLPRRPADARRRRDHGRQAAATAPRPRR